MQFRQKETGKKVGKTIRLPIVQTTLRELLAVAFPPGIHLAPTVFDRMIWKKCLYSNNDFHFNTVWGKKKAIDSFSRGRDFFPFWQDDHLIYLTKTDPIKVGFDHFKQKALFLHRGQTSDEDSVLVAVIASLCPWGSFQRFICHDKPCKLIIATFEKAVNKL